MDLVDKYREWTALREWRKSPLGQALELHTREYFYGNIRSLAGMSDKAKENLIGGLYSQVQAVGAAPNQFLAMREAVAEHVLRYVSMVVLSLTKEEKQGSELFADCSYVSGELHAHLRAISQHNKELRELCWTHEDLTDDELLGFCNTRGAVYLYFLNAFNIVRRAMDDYDSTKDWLRPFIKSMAIWEEDSMRGKIDLPRLLPNHFDALAHSAFLNIVVNGVRNPYYQWEMGPAADKEEPQ